MAKRDKLPDSFILQTEEIVELKARFEDAKEQYTEAVADLVEDGYTLMQIAEDAPFSYATLRNWVKNQELAG